jgi:glucose-1-phosphate thymidylyltransferase
MVVKGLIVLASNAASGSGPDGLALQRVANRPIVCHVLEEMHQAGIAEVVVVVCAHEAPKLRACIEADGPSGLDLEYVYYERDEIFDQALSAAAELVGDSACVVHAANGMLAQPLRPLVELLRKEASGEQAPDLLALVYEPGAEAGSIGLAARRLLRLVDDLPPHQDGPLDLVDACLFGPGALRRVRGTCWWQGRGLDLVAAGKQLVDDGGRLRVERVRGWWLYDGDTVALLDMNHHLLDTLEPESVVSVNGSAGNRIEGCVRIHPTAIVQSSVIIGPAIVGPGAVVLDAYIGPYTSIGADVRIEGAELERSIILPGASIMHIGGRLVGSVVGRQARIFRDFSLPRALRINVGDGGEVALC